jgi:hypothetical protein
MGERTRSLRWSWLGLAFALGRRTLVISRKLGERTKHLTLSWSNQSKTLDLHITDEPLHPDEERRHLAIGLLEESALISFGQELQVVMEQNLESIFSERKPVRPGWLKRNGYLISVGNDPYFGDLFSRLAPKSRGKYRLDFKLMKDPEYLQRFAEGLYPPAILHSLDPVENHGPITATCYGRRRKPTLLIFPGGKSGRWIMVRQAAFSHLLSARAVTAYEHLASQIHLGHLHAFDKIIAELRLGEIPELKEFLESMREFFSNPKETLRKGKKRAGVK